MHVFPSERGDSFQVTHVVNLRDSAQDAPYRERFHRDLHHGGEALIRQLSDARKDPPGCKVKAKRDGKQ